MKVSKRPALGRTYKTREEEESQVELILDFLLQAQQHHQHGLTASEIARHFIDAPVGDRDSAAFVNGRSDPAFQKAVGRLLDKMVKRFLLCRDDTTLRYTVDLGQPPLILISALRSQLGQRLMPEGLYRAMEATSHLSARVTSHQSSPGASHAISRSTSEPLAASSTEPSDADADAEEDSEARGLSLGAQRERMQRRLERFQNTPFGRWIRKIRRINHNSFGFHQYRQVKDGIYRTLSDALLHETKVKLTYQTNSSERDQVVYFSPLGLVLFGANVYLVGKYGGEKNHDVRRLLVSRIIAIEATDYPISALCKDFDLDAYVDGGFFEFSDLSYDLRPAQRNQRPPLQEVVIRCRSDSTFDRMKEVLNFYPEKTNPSDNTITVMAHVSPELETFLLGEGARIEVLAPSDLRQRIADALKAAAAIYQD